MPNALYTAEAHVTGGRGEGHGRSSDGQLDVQLRLPTEMGGAGADIDASESIAGMRKALAGLDASSNGSFLNYDGTPIAW